MNPWAMWALCVAGVIVASLIISTVFALIIGLWFRANNRPLPAPPPNYHGCTPGAECAAWHAGGDRPIDVICDNHKPSGRHHPPSLSTGTGEPIVGGSITDAQWSRIERGEWPQP